MGNIIPFDFETNAVRVVIVDGDPVFVAADVCRALEIGKYRDAIARLDDDEGCPVVVDTLGGRQAMAGITESGLYALIMMSRKPAAKRFRKWVTSEVLPAIRRDGFYFSAPADVAALAAKRAYYAALPDSHREKADTKVEIVRQVEDLIAQGWKVGEASRAVAAEFGCSERSIYYARRAVYMVPQSDHGAALAPRWSGPRGMLAECHPEAMHQWIALIGSGARVSDCYRRLTGIAAERGWSPIPSERTMRRVGERLLPRDIPCATKTGRVA